MKIQLWKDANPTRVKVRRYLHEQREFLRRSVDTFVENGHAYRNLNATWCSAPLIMLKEGPAKFRVTVDLSPVNKYTMADASLRFWIGTGRRQRKFHLFRLKLRVLATLLRGRFPWLPILHHTWRRVYAHPRISRDSKRCGAHPVECPRNLRETRQSDDRFLDVLLMFAKSEGQLLESLELLFTSCWAFNVKLQPEKWNLFNN